MTTILTILHLDCPNFIWSKRSQTPTPPSFTLLPHPKYWIRIPCAARPPLTPLTGLHCMPTPQVAPPRPTQSPPFMLPHPIHCIPPLTLHLNRLHCCPTLYTAFPPLALHLDCLHRCPTPAQCIPIPHAAPPMLTLYPYFCTCRLCDI